MAIKNGLKYLGYCIKPCCYRIADWQWLAAHFFKRLPGWEFWCLSLGGWVILTQVVLSQMGVYWAHLFYIPTSIINCLNRLMANFILGGIHEIKKYHFTKLSNITFPKGMEGWGIMGINGFGLSLPIKSLWRGLFGSGTWSKNIQHKHLKDKYFSFWYRNATIGIKQGSAILLSFLKIEKYLSINLHGSSNLETAFLSVLTQSWVLEMNALSLRGLFTTLMDAECIFGLKL